MRVNCEDGARAIFAVLALGLACPAVSAAELEEIVVVATKREEIAQQVGLAVTALDERDFRELTAGRLGGLANQLSNVEAYVTDSFLQSVHIRGIGLNEFQGQYDSPVAQHVDEVYISKPWMLARPHFDIGRVEVLKGPQGTLFGRNTTGGAVNYYRAAPSADAYRVVEVRYDEHQRGNLEGVINGGLTDTLSGRFSLRRDFGSGGPQDNLFTGSDHGEPDALDARAQLLWQSGPWTVRVLGHGGFDRGEKVAWKGPGLFNFGAPGYCAEVFTGATIENPETCAKFAGFATLEGSPEGEYEPAGIFTINQNTPPKVDDTFYGGFLRVEYESGIGTFVSLTGYEYYERIHEEDSSSDIFNAVSSHYYNKIDQFTQELRLVGDFSSTARYLVGAYFGRDDIHQVDGSDLSEQPLPGITPPFADQFFAQFDLALNTAAVFGQVEFDVSDELTLNVGARYTEDKTKAKDVMLGIGNLPQVGKRRSVTPCLVTTYPEGPVGSPACPFLGPFAPLFNDRRHDDDLSWRFGAEWTPVQDHLIYANITRGYRAGGYSLPFAGAATTFEPETIHAQEVGVKSTLADGSMQLRVALFNYKFDDVQVNVDDPVSPLVPITRNIGEQKNFGGEVEFEWQINDYWYLNQSLGYLDAEFSDTDRSISTYSGNVALQDKSPINSPKWTYNGYVRLEVPFRSNKTFGALVDYGYTDERYLEATNQPFDRAEAYWIVNARVSFGSADGRWDAYLFARNVFNEKYLTYINNIPFFKMDAYGERRTLGVGARFQF